MAESAARGVEKRKLKFKEKYDIKQKKKKKKSKENENEDFTSAHVSDKQDEESAKKGRPCTVSVALPGSILENAQSPELRTYLAGQVARALVIFNIDEVIIFNESSTSRENKDQFKGSTKASDPNTLFVRILQYLECPQYLRKYFFPVHKDLKYAGLLNPLDCPHHMRIDDISPYREGVTLDRPIKEGEGSFVNVGARKELRIDRALKAGVRVTVQIDDEDYEMIDSKKFMKGKVVSPSTPREIDGIYWGYSVRMAQSFGDVFVESPFPDGYDKIIGTSDKGLSIDEVNIQPYKHILIVFGGLKGLEQSLESDHNLPNTDITTLFDYYVNACPNQGSRTIRTEEAILVTLSALRSKLSIN